MGPRVFYPGLILQMDGPEEQWTVVRTKREQRMQKKRRQERQQERLRRAARFDHVDDNHDEALSASEVARFTWSTGKPIRCQLAEFLAICRDCSSQSRSRRL
jgi:hypothetical protein